MVQKITVIKANGREVTTDFQETPLEYRIKRVRAMVEDMEALLAEGGFTIEEVNFI